MFFPKSAIIRAIILQKVEFGHDRYYIDVYIYKSTGEK